MGKALPIEKRKLRPAHPGAILREDVLPALNMTQGELADALGVSRRSINMICNESRSITADMAHRLGRFIGNGPGIWLRMQQQLDLWDALHEDASQYEWIERAKAA